MCTPHENMTGSWLTLLWFVAFFKAAFGRAALSENANGMRLAACEKRAGQGLPTRENKPSYFDFPFACPQEAQHDVCMPFTYVAEKREAYRDETPPTVCTRPRGKRTSPTSHPPHTVRRPPSLRLQTSVGACEHTTNTIFILRTVRRYDGTDGRMGGM